MVTISQEDKWEIAQMAAQILGAQLAQVQKAHVEIFVKTKEFFDAHPELKGRHQELGAIITKLELSNPKLPIDQLFSLAAEEMSRANYS